MVIPENASKLPHGSCDSDARRAAAAFMALIWLSCVAGSPSSMIGGSIAVLKGLGRYAPPAVAGRRVSETVGLAKSREIAGSDASIEEKDVPVADPEDENDEPALKLKG